MKDGNTCIFVFFFFNVSVELIHTSGLEGNIR